MISSVEVLYLPSVKHPFIYTGSSLGGSGIKAKYNLWNMYMIFFVLGFVSAVF